MSASASETRIPVSRETRKELRIVKAEEEIKTYDGAIRRLLARENADI